MENNTPNEIDIDKISDKAFSKFQMSITPEKISDFFEKSMTLIEKSNSKDFHKLNKADFFSIFTSIFSGEENYNIILNKICELIFERLKEKKCVFEMNGYFSSKNYALADIISTEKIEIMKIQLFLCVIMMTNFKTKLEAMFTVIDTDNDGLINEAEIKKLIITMNKLFCEESKEKFSKSSLIQQSLSNFKANKILSKLFYGKAGFQKVLEEEKYISFDQFYERLIETENYIYEIIPTFINLKNYLSNKNKELEFYINDNCKKDFIDISYDLINENKFSNVNTPRVFMKQLFDGKKLLKKKIIDPLKEIRERQEKQKEIKLKRILENQKREFGKKFNPILRLSLPKNNISATNIKINPQTIKKVLDEKEFNYNTPVVNNKSIANKINKDEEKYKNTKSNKHYKKINTAEFKEKISLYSNREGEKITEKKYPKSFPLLKAIRKKTILNKKFDIPSEISPFNISEQGIKENNNITNNNNLLNFSEMNQNLIKTKGNTTLDNNIDTNFSTLAIINPGLSQKNDDLINFKKISIYKKFPKSKENFGTNKTYIKKDNRINKIIEPISPVYSLLNTTSKKYSNIPIVSSYITNQKKLKEKNIELSDYSKMSSIFFPPCIIKTKEKSINQSFNLAKDDFMNKNDKKIKKKKFIGIDFTKSLLNTYDEVKDDILEELEQQRNYDLNGLNAILRIKKSIEDKTKKFHFVDFNKNKVSFKNFFLFSPRKKKKFGII